MVVFLTVFPMVDQRLPGVPAGLRGRFLSGWLPQLVEWQCCLWSDCFSMGPTQVLVQPESSIESELEADLRVGFLLGQECSHDADVWGQRP